MALAEVMVDHEQVDLAAQQKPARRRGFCGFRIVPNQRDY